MSGGELELARLTALYVDELTGSLTDAESGELADLLARHPDFDSASIDAAVVALQSGVDPMEDELPALLYEQVALDAADFFAVPPGTAALTGSEPAPTPVSPIAPAVVRSRPTGTARRRGWLAAAGAAALVVGAIALNPRTPAWREAHTNAPRPIVAAPSPPPSPPPTPDPTRMAETRAPDTAPATITGTAPGSTAAPADPASGPPDPAAARRAFLATHRWVVQRSWQAGNDPRGAGVRGDVVWDPKSQTGFLRFVGLPRNNPLTEEYQLWIFDGHREQPYPVDGGVFDVTSSHGEEVVIPIHSKLYVDFATTFAVTVERPGGVVVSDRSRVAAIAQIS